MSIRARALALVILAAIGISQWPGGDASAITTKVSMRPALTAGSITDYGLHFDEGDPDDPFGAYDYSGGIGTKVYIRGIADEFQTYPARYRYRRISAMNACDIEASLQRYISGSWQNISGFDQHFLHLQNSAGASWQYTQQIQNQNDTYSKVVGEVGDCGYEPHVHHSAELDGTIDASGKSDDTCWAGGSQCDIGQVREHKDGSTCPPGQQDGTHPSKSGSVAQYICATWQAESRSSSITAFIIP